MPILPKILVRLANKADRQAYINHCLLLELLELSFLSIINKVPSPIKIIDINFRRLIPSFKNIEARIIVKTILDLSIGTTLLMSPSCRALK